MKRVLSAAAAVLMTGSSGYAADFYQPEVIEVPPVEQVVAPAGGWYLRGDTGFSLNKMRGARYFQGSNKNMHDFDTAKLGNGFSIGGGVGYQIDDHLRTDVTLDYMFKSKFRGSTSGFCGGVACHSSDRSSMTALSLLANAYVDIGTYGIFTPYVGGGIGGTYVKWNNLDNTICDDPANPGCYTTAHGGKKSWRFTYALMAGASVDLTCNLKADVGYRFRHITKGDMFGFKANGGPGYDKGFYTHEARAGLRYAFSGCEEQVYIPPADIPISQPVYK